jgi:hypothetical protein
VVFFACGFVDFVDFVDFADFVNFADFVVFVALVVFVVVLAGCLLTHCFVYSFSIFE